MLMLHAKTRKAIEELRDEGRDKVLLEDIVTKIEEKYDTELDDKDSRVIRHYVATILPKKPVTVEIYEPDGDGIVRKQGKKNMYYLRW